MRCRRGACSPALQAFRPCGVRVRMPCVDRQFLLRSISIAVLVPLSRDASTTGLVQWEAHLKPPPLFSEAGGAVRPALGRGEAANGRETPWGEHGEDWNALLCPSDSKRVSFPPVSLDGDASEAGGGVSSERDQWSKKGQGGAHSFRDQEGGRGSEKNKTGQAAAATTRDNGTDWTTARKLAFGDLQIHLSQQLHQEILVRRVCRRR